MTKTIACPYCGGAMDVPESSDERGQRTHWCPKSTEGRLSDKDANYEEAEEW